MTTETPAKVTATTLPDEPTTDSSILLTCDCDDRSEKCALGRQRTLATANYNRCCLSVPSVFGKSLASATNITTVRALKDMP